MSLPEMDQLFQAKQLAMANSPEQMLPKVLETSASLYHSKSASTLLKLELSRFIPDLLLDILRHEQIPVTQKPFIASQHLNCLWSICQNVRDSIAYKFSILAFSASYPLLFDLVAKASNQEMWDTMQQMKTFIVSKWNTTYPLNPSSDNANEDFIDDARSIGTRLATAKFISEIVIVHTSRNNSSNSSGKNRASSISISSVPDNHPIISNKQSIESEAKKFLDILLNYLIEEPMMVSSIFIGILNCLSFIMKQRPQATMRIITSLLKFNVDAKFQADNISVLNYRLGKRFVERCYKNFVQFGLKSQLIKNSGSMSAQHSKLSKISQTLYVIGEETRSKGILNFVPEEIENKMSNKDKQKYALLRKKQQMPRSLTKDQSLPSIVSPPLQQATLNNIDNSVVNTNGNNSNTRNDRNGRNSNSTGANSSSRSVSGTSNVDSTTKLLMNLQNYTMSKNNISTFFNSSPVTIDNSYSSIYSLMNSKNSEQDMSELPQDVIIKLCSEAFYKTDTTRMISGLSIVASRYTDLMNKATQIQTDSKKRKAEDQHQQEEQEQSKKVKREGSVDLKVEEGGGDNQNDDNDDYTVESEHREHEVELMKPTPMTAEQKMAHVERIVQNIMSIKDSDENPGITSAVGKGQQPLEKIKILEWDNSKSWLCILTRLVTRGLSSNERMSDFIRQTLYDYFIQDFNGRIGMVLEWLAEEWYYESLTGLDTDNSPLETSFVNYDKWSIKLLEGLNPLLENQHRRTFIRLMSELPRIQQQHIDMIRPICLDPARTSLGFQTLKFLVMFRPPVKPMVKIFLETLKQEDETASEQCVAILNKFY